jgi:major membrane immunogen (membrane-anchored lipoprotein)
MNAHLKILSSLIAGVLFCGVLMTSCKKDNDSNNSGGGDDDDGYGSMTITGGSIQQTIDFTQARQLRASTSTGNRFVIYFSGTYMVVFGASDLSATTLPSGTYQASITTPTPEGAAGVVLTLPETGLLNSSKGSFKVQKNSSNYNITFNFTTDSTPALTVTGSYKGTIPLSAEGSKSSAEDLFLTSTMRHSK